MLDNISFMIRILCYATLILIISSCNYEREKVLNFDSCSVVYKIYSRGEKELYAGHFLTNVMELESANRKLALCFCEKYVTLKEENINGKIIEPYRAEETYFSKTFPIDLPFDSILVHREEVFDPTILIY